MAKTKAEKTPKPAKPVNPKKAAKLAALAAIPLPDAELTPILNPYKPEVTLDTTRAILNNVATGVETVNTGFIAHQETNTKAFEDEIKKLREQNDALADANTFIRPDPKLITDGGGMPPIAEAGATYQAKDNDVLRLLRNRGMQGMRINKTPLRAGGLI